MANINASALNSLQTRINAERSRRSLSPVTFTDGTLSAGGTIKATHFAELRTYTEGLNTLGSQTFNWSGTVSVGASITDVITQISNFVTTLEGEALAGWKVLLPTGSVEGSHTQSNTASWFYYEVPSQVYGMQNKVRITMESDACTAMANRVNLSLFGACSVGSATSAGIATFTPNNALGYTPFQTTLNSRSGFATFASPNSLGTDGIYSHSDPKGVASPDIITQLRAGGSKTLASCGTKSIYDSFTDNNDSIISLGASFGEYNATIQGQVLQNKVLFDSSYKYVYVHFGYWSTPSLDAFFNGNHTSYFKIEAYY